MYSLTQNARRQWRRADLVLSDPTVCRKTLCAAAVYRLRGDSRHYHTNGRLAVSLLFLLRMLHSASGFASVTLSIGRIFAMHMALPCPHYKQVMALIMQAKMEYNVNEHLMREYMEA
jgi:hypothetical protein